jgi:hypothetical protein
MEFVLIVDTVREDGLFSHDVTRRHWLHSSDELVCPACNSTACLSTIIHFVCLWCFTCHDISLVTLNLKIFTVFGMMKKIRAVWKILNCYWSSSLTSLRCIEQTSVGGIWSSVIDYILSIISNAVRSAYSQSVSSFLLLSARALVPLHNNPFWEYIWS